MVHLKMRMVELGVVKLVGCRARKALRASNGGESYCRGECILVAVLRSNHIFNTS